MKDNRDDFIYELIKELDHWFDADSAFNPVRMEAKLYPYDHLFSPIQINSVRVKNRIVMGPMGNVYMAEESGRPSEKMIRFLTERAQGGVGLITSGLVPVGQGIDPGLTEPGDLSLFPRIDRSRTLYSGWHTLVENLHSFGARFFIQLSPGAGRVGSPLTLLTKGQLPVSSSWNPNFYLPQLPCRPLWDHEARTLIRRMAQAAVDARELGIDGAYIHGHEGYLLDQMSNPAFNRRILSRYSDPRRYALETVAAMRKRVGPDYPIMYRIGLSLGLNACYGERMKCIGSLKNFRNERWVSTTLELMSELVQAGVDIFDVDLGTYDNWWLPHPPGSMPPAAYLAVARLVKDHFTRNHVRTNQGAEVGVVAVGKLGYPDLAEKALQDGDCDMVMLARPLLADADWAVKAYAGKVSQIRPCIGDQEACLKAFVNGTHIQCAVNPRCGFEDVLTRHPTPAERMKKVAVVGAGPAGLTASITAARRGHQVHLFEKGEAIGGMMLPGCVPTIKYDVANYLEYLRAELSETQNKHSLSVHLNETVQPDDLKKANFDVVVAASGGKLIRPPIEGLDGRQVVDAVELLLNPKLAHSANQVLVVGGGALGCETALWLAAELGKKVSIIEVLPVFMKAVVTANRGHLIHLLEKNGVELLNCTRLKKVAPGQVVVERNVSSSVPDPYNTWNPVLPENVENPLVNPIRENIQEQSIQADLVVLATGYKADTTYYEDCVQRHAAVEIH